MRVRVALIAAAAFLVAVVPAHAGPISGYPDLTGDAALQLAREHFDQVLSADPSPPLPAAVDHVYGYAAENVARANADGRTALVVSSRPLAARQDGQLRPVDLDLGGGESLEPGNAPYELVVGARDGTFRIGDDLGSSVLVEPIGTGASQTDMTKVDGKAFLANSRTDTDTIFTASASGLETFEHIRSPDAPEDYRWRLTIPAGASIQTRTLGYDVVRGDDVLLRIRAPWAVDAAGQPVGLTLGLDGEVLTMHVSHRDRPVSYPVLVDPNWNTSYHWDTPGGSGSQGFFELDEPVPGFPAGGYELSVNDSAEGPGLWIWPKGGGNYFNAAPDGNEVRGSIYFYAPGTTRLVQATWHGVRYQLDQRDCASNSYNNVNQFVRFTLSLNGATSVSQQIGPDGNHGDLTNAGGTVITLTDPSPTPSGRNASVAMWTKATNPGTPKYIAPNPGTSGCRAGLVDPYVNVGAMDLVLTDMEAPTVEAVSGQIRDYADDIDNAWLSGPELASEGSPGQAVNLRATGHVRVSDPGSGVREVFVQAVNETTTGAVTFRPAVNPPFSLCDFTHRTDPTPADPSNDQQGRICPELYDWSLDDDPVNLSALGASDGIWDLTATVTDLVEQSSTTAPWHMYVDTTAPHADVFTLTAPPAGDNLLGNWIAANDAGAELEASLRAVDPASIASNGVSTGVHSGIKDQELDLDPDDGRPVTPLIPSGTVSSVKCGPGSDRPYTSIHQPCDDGGPTDHATIARYLGEGKKTLRARITDFAGNKSGDIERSFWVDNTGPTIALTGSLADLDDSWLDPQGPLTLNVHAEDAKSGVSATTAHLEGEDGSDQLGQPHGSCPTPQRDDAPDPICPATTDHQIDIPGEALPEGRVRITAEATDAVGNTTPRSGQPEVILHVDRTPPEVALTGEVAKLAVGGWANPGQSLTATVQASDQGAGIKALQLWVNDQRGERMLEERIVCRVQEPAETGDMPPCPPSARANFQVPDGTATDGRTAFEGRAIEFTGRRARARKTNYLDTTPPEAPRDIVVTRTGTDTATVTYNPPPNPPDQSAIAGYEYAVTYAGSGTPVWNKTPHTGIPLSGLPAGLDTTVLICAVDEAGNRSLLCASDPIPELATQPVSGLINANMQGILDWLSGPPFIEINGLLYPVAENGIVPASVLRTLLKRTLGLSDKAYEAAAKRARWVGVAVRLLLGAEKFAAQHAKTLQELIPPGSRGRVTMAVGIGRDSKGVYHPIIATSEKYGYMRPEVNKYINKYGYKRALGYVGHAEEQVLQHMRDYHLKPITVGAGRPICAKCAQAIANAKATPATPLKRSVVRVRRRLLDILRPLFRSVER